MMPEEGDKQEVEDNPQGGEPHPYPERDPNEPLPPEAQRAYNIILIAMFIGMALPVILFVIVTFL